MAEQTHLIQLFLLFIPSGSCSIWNKAGDRTERIILAHWHNENVKDFTSYPITNNRTIDNESLERLLRKRLMNAYTIMSLFAKILDLYLDS